MPLKFVGKRQGVINIAVFFQKIITRTYFLECSAISKWSRKQAAQGQTNFMGFTQDDLIGCIQ